MTTDEFAEEDRHIRAKAVETNLALWNALLMADSILISVFSVAAVFQTGTIRWVLAAAVICCLVSAGVLVAVFASARDLYRSLGQLSDDEVAAMSEQTKTERLRSAGRMHRRINFQERIVKTLLVIQAFLVILLVVCVGCTQEPGAPPGSTGASTSLPAPQPTVFEVRDFRIDGDPRPTGGWHGKGTVFAVDPRLQKGSYLLYLKERTSHPRVIEDYKVVIVKDGTGPIETHHYDFEGKGSEKPKYEWTLMGFAQLQEGTLKVVE